MNQNYFEPNPIYNSSYFGFNQPPQYSINHQEDLNQQRISDVHVRWDKIEESLQNIMQSFYEVDEFIKSSVEDLVPIPSESEDISESDSDCDLPSCDNISPINVSEEKSITFSNPLFYSNDDFTSSDDESLSDEDVLEDNVKTYSNPLFEFDDEYISSDVNPLFDEVLEDIACKDSYDSNLDESIFLVTPLSDSNEDECFTPSDDVELLLHRDSSTPMISVVSILEGFTDEPPLEENDDLFDLESKGNEWKKILYDASIDDLMTEDKDCPDFEDSRARGFVHRPLDLQSFACLYMGIRFHLGYSLPPQTVANQLVIQQKALDSLVTNSRNIMESDQGMSIDSRALYDELKGHGAWVGESPTSVMKDCKYTNGMLSDPYVVVSVTDIAQKDKNKAK
ncbi:hypothetical protein Tco_1285270 [Tanacetum coccineum]